MYSQSLMWDLYFVFFQSRFGADYEGYTIKNKEADQSHSEGTGTRKLTISSPSINLTKKNARVNKFCFNRKRKASKFIFKEEVLGILSKPCLMTTWQIE